MTDLNKHMIFPFSIKCKKKFKKKVSSGDTDNVMSYIQDIIEKKTCESITLNGCQLIYKTGSFRNKWNTDILASVEKGKFNLINNGAESILTYEFFMYHMFLGAFIISILIGLVSSKIWTGAICFVWLGGMNWVIAFIRHRKMLRDIVIGIETNFDEKKGSL
jgi:hypothetical protein